MTRPAVVNGSANILNSGRLKEPADVLSPMKTMMGSDGRSSMTISAEPGPMPRTLPEKASERRSWPAPYKWSFLATSVPARNASHAVRCTCSSNSPRVCVMIRKTSSPQWLTL